MGMTVLEPNNMWNTMPCHTHEEKNWKFIYILDAYDDVEQDLESGSYNALISLYGEPDFDERCKEMMTYVLAECTSQF